MSILTGKSLTPRIPSANPRANPRAAVPARGVVPSAGSAKADGTNTNAFTIAEFLVAMVMFLLIIAALTALSVTTASRQSVENRKNFASTNAMVLMRHIKLQLQQTVAIQDPAPAAPAGSVLSGGVLPYVIYADGPKPTNWYTYCLDSQGNVRFFVGPDPTNPWPPQAIDCDNASGGTLLANKVRVLNFSRVSATLPGLVSVQITVDHGYPMTITRDIHAWMPDKVTLTP